MPPINIALIGAGIFARDAHVPGLLDLADRFTIAAVYSRTRANAEALAASIPGQPRATNDLDSILNDDAIEAVDILLPIGAMEPVIAAALRAGKHVISEKPIAATMADARDLVAQHRAGDRVWAVAENWRWEAGYLQAGDVIRGANSEIGKPLVANWSLYIDAAGGKYYGTEWRRDNSFPGGFLLDGGVHHVAAMRLVLGEIVRVSATTALSRADLPPADTLTAALTFASGAIGTYSVTYAAGAGWRNTLDVLGDRGWLRVDRTSLEIGTPGNSRSVGLGDGKSIHAELAEFADAIQSGSPLRNTPIEALRDLAVIEAMLHSASHGQAITVDLAD